ncbi:MAG TPA: ABC transporter permease, partial [Nitriliruptorales bacterium]|nr:ABC transporter permease [Nitriliruptorales bacterium]
MSTLVTDRREDRERLRRAPERRGGPAPGGLRSRLRRPLRYLGTPLLVAVAFGLLYRYVQARELDSIEARILDARNLQHAAIEHLDISLWSTAIVLATAIPVGIALTRPWARRATPAFVTVANIGQGVPAIGTFVLAFLIVTRSGRTAAIVGLVVYCFLPVLRATMVGLEQVDPGVIKAGRGMGLSRGQVLRRIELPLSVPILLTGVRTALVLNVSTAPLAGFVGGGTLGRIIIGGFAQSRAVAVLTGAVLAAGFALLADWIGGVAEDVLR